MEVEVQHLNFLDSLGSSSINEILESWNDFCLKIEVLLNSRENIYSASEFTPCISLLCKFGLDCLVQEHILHVLEEKIIKRVVAKFWNHFQSYSDGAALKTNRTHIPETLCESLEEICSEKLHQEKCLLMLGHAIQSCKANSEMENLRQEIVTNCLLSRFQLMVSSILMTTLPRNFPDILQIYFTVKLEELSTVIVEEYEQTHKFQSTVMTDIGESCMSSSNISDMVEINCSTMDTTNNNLVKNIGKVVYELRSLGFASMAEDAYASAIFFFLRNPALDSIKEWIQVVPLSFLRDLLAYLGDSTGCEYISIPKSPLVTQPTCYTGMLIPSEELVRWKLRLEYFAYETLQELRIERLFDIIVDYPDSSPAIEDLKNCLEYTGQHSKLVDSFISALKYRLLTAGASTNDILHQYVSTIRALRTIDPAGVFLEAVGEPIRDYLKGRTDTIKCIVTMLTDGTGGNASGGGNNGDSLLEELNRVAENQETIDVEEEFNSDEKQAWINAEYWEPDPVEADPSKSSMNRRKFNLLGMIVNIIGSKDQLVNEYRVMLAEKLLNKSDYDLDSEIRTLELLKIHFGENSMQRCEIMLNDLLDSKRTNTNIKASTACKGMKEGNMELSLDLIDATIISSNFWPPIQDENLKIPPSTDVLLSDYARRFHEIKTPRKLLWKKNLGVVKLELEFENQTLQFSVTPMHATIIMKFQEQASWTSKNLADAIGVSTETLNRRINFWINKGIVMESSTPQEPEDHIFTLVEDVGDTIHNGTHGGRFDEVMVADEEGDRAVASVQEQLLKEMTVYEKFITGMLTNFGSMSLDRIHNTLKIFCVSDPSYDKSLHQLQSFLSGLLSEEKLELRDGMYFLKK